MISFLVTVREKERITAPSAVTGRRPATRLDSLSGEKVAKLLHILIDSLSLKFYGNRQPGFHLSVKQILGKFAKKEMTCKLDAFPPNGWSKRRRYRQRSLACL